MSQGGAQTEVLPPPQHAERVAASRRTVLEAIGATAGVTLVAGPGNLGDQLIAAGARELLGDLVEREITIEELGASEGEVAALVGSGALCRPFHEWKPHAIAVAEVRFERVVVLPSSIDPGEDCVREALARTRAIVLCREPVSLAAVDDLCDARLALDSALHFDYGRVERAWNGVLNAFRTDAEQRPGSGRPPPGNDDISLTAPSLDVWLRRIGSASRVRTDRAHVMIAGAMLGKPVAYAASSYHKLPAIAEWSLSGFDVSAIEPGKPPPAPRRAWRPRLRPAPRPRVEAIVSTRDRPHLALAAVDSALAERGTAAIVVDSNSSPANRERLAASLASRRRAVVRALDRDPGREGGRGAGLEAATAELVLLLDDDVLLEPGAVALMRRALDADAGAIAATPTVLDASGRVEHAGGSLAIDGSVARLRRRGAGLHPDDPGMPGGGPCDWAPHSALLARREALARLAPGIGVNGFGDRDWALAAHAAGARLVYVPAALARRAVARDPRHAVAFAERMRRLELAAAAARIRERHGVVLGDLFEILPGLGDVGAAEQALDLMRDRGPHAVLAAWDAGELDGLLGAPR